MIDTLTTERCTLRGPVESDFAACRDFFADPVASAHYGGPLREDRAWRFFALNFAHWQLRGYGLWTIERKTDGAVLGACGFWWPQGWPRRELTWWLLPESRGTGIATEVSKAAIAHGYDVYDWDLVETHMDDDNDAARRLVERLGADIIARETFPDGLTRNIFRLPHPARG